MHPNSIDLDRYGRYPERLEDLIRETIDNGTFFVNPENGWSPHQIFLHILDAEAVYYDRIKRVLTEESPQLRGWEQEPWISTEVRDQGHEKLENDIGLLHTLRRKLTAILQEVSGEDWQRTGIHTRDGELTLEGWVIRQINHSVSHLNKIEQLLHSL